MNRYCEKACLIAIIPLLLILVEAMSYAENHAGLKYLRLGIGAGFLNFKTNKDIKLIDTSLKTGFVLDMSGGYYLNDRSQVTLLVGIYRKNDDISQIRSYELLANYRYDFSPYRDFSPYAKIGIGIISNSLSRSNIANSAMHFTAPAATLGFGISYNLSQALFIDTGYTMQLSMNSHPSSEEGVPTDQVDAMRANNIKAGSLLHTVTFGAGFRF